MTILHDLVALYNQLPRDNVYSLVIVCILQNLSRIPVLSLEQTAELCGVSPITISRLLKKLSCSSYRIFKQQIADVVDAYPKYNRVIPIPMLDPDNATDSYLDCILHELEDLKKEIDRDALENACAMIHGADIVHFCDMYARGHSKRQFQADLWMDGKVVQCHGTPGDCAYEGGSSVMLITVLTASKNYGNLVRTLRDLHKAGMKCIIIASSSTPAGISENADIMIRFRGLDSAADNILIDNIYNLLCINYRAAYMD